MKEETQEGVQCYLVALYVPIICVGITHSSVDHYNSRTRKTACMLLEESSWSRFVK
jgi:hypothetical protein